MRIYLKASNLSLPKLKPYVAIKALLTIIIPTDVTTLNAHDAMSPVFLSVFFIGAIFRVLQFYSFMVHLIVPLSQTFNLQSSIFEYELNTPENKVPSAWTEMIKSVETKINNSQRWDVCNNVSVI